MSNCFKPVILDLHALRCHCGVKVGMVSPDIDFSSEVKPVDLVPPEEIASIAASRLAILMDCK